MIRRGGARGPAGVLAAVALLLSELPSAAAPPIGNPPPPPEYDVKAAYLLNFTRYVDWPESSFADSEAPIIIGVFGENPFGSSLERTLEGRTSHGRPLMLRRISRPGDADSCHLVFIDRGVREPERILRAIRGLPVLTVGESRGFLRDGGGIRLVLIQDTVQFEVNLDATSAAELKVSSRMLSLAHRVIGGDPAGVGGAG